MLYSVCLLLCVLTVSTYERDKNSIIVSFKQGKIEGFADTSTGGNTFYSFLKIPYAKPPVGNLRFENPQQPDSWNGIRNGKEKPPPCSQINYHQMLKDYKTPFAYKGDEDCLFVNVYTKQFSEEADLPVLVFFHGGGFSAGSINEYGPHDLLDEDVVLIFVQYRLGLLGFLWTEDSALPSNLGLKDQTLALKWVQENVGSFGGDPNQVTIFGVSAGGASVHAHILSDYSNGLFSRAIVMSGTLLCPWARMVKPRETAMKVGDQLGCFKNSTNQGLAKSKQLAKCLREVDVEDIQRVTRDLFEWSFLPKRTVPYFDGDFFPENFEEMVKKSRMKAVDVIYGVARDEGAFVSSAMLMMEEQRRAIKDQFPTIGPLSLAFEMEKNPVQLSQVAYDYYVGGVKNEMEDYHNLTRLYGDHHFKVCSDICAIFHSKLNSKSKKKTYYYEYNHRGENSITKFLDNPPITNNMVSHGDDLFALFTTFYGEAQRNLEDEKMAKLMTKMFFNFAKHGDPTPDMSLGFKWEPFSEDSPRHLKIKLQPRMEDDLRKRERNFWKSLPTNQSKILFGEEKSDKEEL